MADAKQFEKVRDIVRADPARRVIVVSAAGKRDADDHKLTDLLYLCHAHLQYGVSCESIFQMICERYIAIRDECGLSVDIEAELDVLRQQLRSGISEEELVSRGEYFSALLMADYLGYSFLDAELWLKFSFDGSIDTERLRAEMPNIHISFQLNATTGTPDTYLNGELVEKEIRSLQVSNHVSPIAALPFVREALVTLQRQMGAAKGVVMDGRDIGTTVFPDAELKVFVTASAAVRAQRRYDELQAKGMPAKLEDILKNVEERDYIDTHREVSPLRKADDAVELDNSHMTIPEQDKWLMDIVTERCCGE